MPVHLIGTLSVTTTTANDGFSTMQTEWLHRTPKTRQKIAPQAKYCSISA